MKLDNLTTAEELLAHRKVLAARLEELDENKRGIPLASEERDEFATTAATISELDMRVAEIVRRAAIIRDLARNPRNVEAADVAGTPLSSPTMQGATRELGLRAIERHSHRLSAQANDTLDTLVRNDPLGLGARYLDAVADTAYAEAFGLIMQHGAAAQVRMTPAQTAAVMKVSQTMAERALSEGTGSTGGFAVPYVLDPSIVLSSSGALNPIRQLANVKTIAASNEWRGVSSDGVTANWYAEAAEVTDDSPTLAQPTVTVRRASAFVPFSIELGDDWGSLQQELTKLISDANFAGGACFGETHEPLDVVLAEVLLLGSVRQLDSGQEAADSVAQRLPHFCRAAGVLQRTPALRLAVINLDSVEGEAGAERVHDCVVAVDDGRDAGDEAELAVPVQRFTAVGADGPVPGAVVAFAQRRERGGARVAVHGKDAAEILEGEDAVTADLREQATGSSGSALLAGDAAE